MKQLVPLFILSLAVLPASAQLMVNKAGQVRIGKSCIPEEYKSLSLPQKIIGGGVDVDPLPEVDSLASLVVLGPGRNGSGSYISFGKGDYVGIGEYSLSNPDVLTLVGRRGLSYITKPTTEVFKYDPTTSRFQFNCDVYTNGLVFCNWDYFDYVTKCNH